MQADIIFINAHIYTMDKHQPLATALAVTNGHISAVGDTEHILTLRGPHTQLIDAQGKAILPGFTDSHIHLVEWAMQRRRVDLWGVPSLAEALRRIQEKSRNLPPGEWVRGGGWDASLWPDLKGEWPTAEHLDVIAPDRPVALDSKDLHSLWVNSYVLRMANITAHTPDPAGGVIVRDPKTGEPTGVLKETACELVERLYPEETEQQWEAALEDALPALWAEGIVAVHILNDRADMRNFRTLQRLREKGRLKLRALQYIPRERQDDAIRLGLRSGFGDRYLRIGGIKYFADGTLGSRTAAMLRPYVGSNDNVGVMVTDPEDMYEGFRAASAAGLAVAVHAIGDRANREVLNIFDILRQEEKERGRPLLPHRIEHVQILHPEDVKRLGQYGLVASMQPIHATQDMDLARTYWGDERSRYAYAWRSVEREGAILIFGSDAPVERPSVLAGLHAALTRRRGDGSPGPRGWVPEERMCPRPALHAYTLAPALVERTHAWRGSLTVGKVADLVMLDGEMVDAAYNAPDTLLKMRVVLTLFEGEIVYDARA